MPHRRVPLHAINSKVELILMIRIIGGAGVVIRLGRKICRRGEAREQCRRPQDRMEY